MYENKSTSHPHPTHQHTHPNPVPNPPHFPTGHPMPPVPTPPLAIFSSPQPLSTVTPCPCPYNPPLLFSAVHSPQPTASNCLDRQVGRGGGVCGGGVCVLIPAFSMTAPPRPCENGTPHLFQNGGAISKGAMPYVCTCFPGAKKPMPATPSRMNTR